MPNKRIYVYTGIIIVSIILMYVLKKNNIFLESLLEEKISVQILGEVANPGVYEINIGDTLEQLLNLAGGLTKEADLEEFDMNEKIENNEKIVIQKIEAAEDVNETEDKIDNNIVDKININTAGSSLIEQLPGIGEVMAQRIIEYRQKNNGFTSIEEIMNVAGIGKVRFEKNQGFY